jgi:hypothetical protein
VVAYLVEALCYKPEGRGFDPMRSLDFWNLPNPSSRTTALGSTRPPTEMRTTNHPGGKGRQVRKADNLTDCLENVAASTSHNRMGLHGLLLG